MTAHDGSKPNHAVPLIGTNGSAIGNGHSSGHLGRSSQNILTITDDRTGKQFVIPITNNAIPAIAFKDMKTPENPDFPSDQN